MTTPTSSPPSRGEAVDEALHQDVVEKLIKSRQRVKAHGEVFTPRHMVNKMLDLVSPELENGPAFVDKTVLEPSAGDGNFLIAILHRKLRAIERRYERKFWSTESLFALASIYGIELLADNLEAARAGVLYEFVSFHDKAGIACGDRTNLRRSAESLIRSNVLQGNTLTGLDASGQEIEFSWWHRLPDSPRMVQREPFTFSSLRGASAGILDFAVYKTYSPCRIDHVHKEVTADD